MGDNLASAFLGTGRFALQVASGYQRSCAILDNGSLKCWGRNDKGQLGIGDVASPIGVTAAQMGDGLPYVMIGTGHTKQAKESEKGELR